MNIFVIVCVVVGPFLTTLNFVLMNTENTVAHVPGTMMCVYFNSTVLCIVDRL